MKRILAASLLTLSLFALARPARALDFCGPWPYKVETGVNAYFRVYKYPEFGGQQLGPWYQYWPLEAHFQQVAPTGYPTWPQPMSLPPDFRAPRPTPYPQFQPPQPTPYPPFVPPQPTPYPNGGQR